MGFAEFEEKEFEKPLYNQLENGRCDVWSPGQCLEAHIGFDFSGNIDTSEFWDRFGRFIPKGVILDDYKMGYVLKKMKKEISLPNYSLNLFIQAKRPYVHSGTYGESVYDFKHYSFEIKQNQQRILEKLDHKLKHRALLVYASPVFGTYEELYKYTKDRIMISNTSFPKVSNLSGHIHWYYCNANSGFAYSEPEKCETEHLFDLIDELKYKQVQVNESYHENLELLANLIADTLKEFNEDVQANYYFYKLNSIQKSDECMLYARKYDYNYRDIISFLKIKVFCEVFNLNWFALQQT